MDPFTNYEQKHLLEALAEDVIMGHWKYNGVKTAMKRHTLFN